MTASDHDVVTDDRVWALRREGMEDAARQLATAQERLAQSLAHIRSQYVLVAENRDHDLDVLCECSCLLRQRADRDAHGLSFVRIHRAILSRIRSRR